MATFTVAGLNGTVTTYEGHYKINEAGVLSVIPDRGKPIVFSPSGWLAVELQDAPPSLGHDSILIAGG